MRVRIPSPLHSYTAGAAEVDGTGETLKEMLDHLEGRFPGIRFRVVDEHDRIRQHIRFFVSGHMVRTIAHPVGPGDEVMIVAAISGG